MENKDLFEISFSEYRYMINPDLIEEYHVDFSENDTEFYIEFDGKLFKILKNDLSFNGEEFYKVFYEKGEKHKFIYLKNTSTSKEAKFIFEHIRKVFDSVDYDFATQNHVEKIKVDSE